MPAKSESRAAHSEARHQSSAERAALGIAGATTGFPRQVLLFDGECGVCNGLVKFALDMDRRSTLLFSTLDGAFATRVFAEHAELRSVDSMLWVEQDRPGDAHVVLMKSDAMIALFTYLGGWRRWAAAAYSLVPRVMRDGAYDLFARIRHRVAPRVTSCSTDARLMSGRMLD